MIYAEINYSDIELDPILTAETIRFHYGKHHMGYYNMLMALIKDTNYETLSLEEIIVQSRGRDIKIFNNASQLFNHNFYWKCLKKDCNKPEWKLKDLIEKQFDNFDNFIKAYIDSASTIFGSGWAWIVQDKEGKLNFFNTQNAENPIGTDMNPVCVVDLWEHAYYIDYRNDRAKYLKSIIVDTINWDFCESQLR